MVPNVVVVEETQLVRVSDTEFVVVSVGAQGPAGPPGAPGPGGDMLLGTEQTVTAPKIFQNAAMVLRNIADTFNGIFAHEATAARTWVLQDRDGVLADDADLATKMDIAVYDTLNHGVVDLSHGVVVHVRNNTGVTLLKGQAVYISGGVGQIATIALAKADTEGTSANTIGLLTTDILNNGTGLAMRSGALLGVDTSAFVDGDALWLDDAVAGSVTTTKPLSPSHLVFIGVVTNAHNTQGSIAVSVVNGYEMEELHDVLIDTPADKNLIQRDAALGLWVNAPGRGQPNGVASLGADSKIPLSELPAAIAGAMNYQGTWDASTNTPALASGVGTKGYYYRVSVAGTTNLDGNAQWSQGDFAVFNGTVWEIWQGNMSEADMAAVIFGAAAKAVLVDADALPVLDSGTGFSLKKFTLTNLKTYLGGAFAALAGSAAQVFAVGAATDPAHAVQKTQMEAAIAAAVAGAVLPAGAVAHFAMSAPPTGWLKADGATVSRTTYATLFAAIGTTFGVGDGATTFVLPDLRGEFVRGFDDGRGVDAGRAFGSAQGELELGVEVTATQFRSNWTYGTGLTQGGYLPTSVSTAGAETRPRNIALLACIKI